MTKSETDPSAKSFDDLRARSKSGDSEAEYNLGVTCADGLGVRQNNSEAVR